MDAKYLSWEWEWELSAAQQPALHAILHGSAHPTETRPHCLWHPNCAAAPGHSMYCQGREKEAISWGSSASLTFKSFQGCLHLCTGCRGGKAPGVDAWKAETPHRGEDQRKKWRSALCAEFLCNRLIAAEEKSVCLILMLLHMFNFHDS